MKHMEKLVELECQTGSEDWKLSRNRNFLVLCLQALLHGIELTCLEATEYFYYFDVLHSSYPVVMYSLSCAVVLTSAFISSLISSYYIGVYKKHRILLLQIALSIVGYLVYSLPISAGISILGKFLVGFGRASNIVATLFVQKHLYEDKDVVFRVGILSNFVTFGSTLGPVITYVSIAVDTRIGAMKLTYANFPGLVLCVSKLVVFVVLLIFLEDLPAHDCPKRYIYKRKSIIQAGLTSLVSSDAPSASSEPLLKIHQEKSGNKNENIKVYNKISFKRACCEIFHLDMQLMLCMVLLSGTAFKSIMVIFPVLGYKYLSWHPQHLATLSIACAVFGIAIAVMLAWCSHYTNHLGNTIVGLCCGTVAMLLLSLLPTISRNILASTISFCFIALLNVIAACMVGLCGKLLMNKIMPERLAKVADALRLCCSELAGVAGALLVPLLNSALEVSSIVLLALLLLTTGLFVVNFRPYFRGNICKSID